MADRRIAERIESTDESNDSFNKQIGVRNIWDGAPPMEAETSGIRARGLPVSTPEEEEMPLHDSGTAGVHIEEPSRTHTQMSDMERMILMMQTSISAEFRAAIEKIEAARAEDRAAIGADIRASSEKTKAAIQSLRKEAKEAREETKAEIQEVKNTIRAEIKELKEENLRMYQEARAESRRVEAEIQDIKKNFNTEVTNIRGEGERMRTKMKENSEALSELKVEVTNNKQTFVTKTQNLSESINHISNELHGEMKTTQEETIKVIQHHSEMEEQVRRLEEDKKKKLEEMTREQESLWRRINEVDGCGIHKVHTTDRAKEVTFNGIDIHPMEFLRELTELNELYHRPDDTM